MLKWYYGKIWQSWLNSESRQKMTDKRGLPDEMELPMERKAIYTIYTLLAPLVLIEMFIQWFYKKVRK